MSIKAQSPPSIDSQTQFLPALRVVKVSWSPATEFTAEHRGNQTPIHSQT